MSDPAARAACEAAYARFPGLAGVKPALERDGPRRVYVFSSSGPGPGGKTLRQVVRVTVDEGGRVLKVSASK
jgi:hypothetical protein